MPLPAGTHVLPDPEAVAREAAERLIAACGEAGGGAPIAVCLAGGSTPKRLYALLAGPDYAARVPWGRIHWFFGDERVVPWDDPRSNLRMVSEAFGDAPVPAARLHAIPTDAGAAAGADAYARALSDFYGADRLDPDRPRFDLVLLGLGEDGHTASLFPGKPAVEEARALAVPVPEAGLAPFVPRVSLTLPALTSARHVLFLVTGSGKRAALGRLAAGEDLPAGRVRSRGRVAWLLDAAAAG